MLPDPVAKVRFLGLQLELLEDFRIRLVQVMKEAGHLPTGHAYTAVLNAVHYITSVLKEWNELVVSLLSKISRKTNLLHLHEIVEGLYFHCSLSVCLCVSDVFC